MEPVCNLKQRRRVPGRASPQHHLCVHGSRMGKAYRATSSPASRAAAAGGFSFAEDMPREKGRGLMYRTSPRHNSWPASPVEPMLRHQCLISDGPCNIASRGRLDTHSSKMTQRKRPNCRGSGKLWRYARSSGKLRRDQLQAVQWSCARPVPRSV